MTPEERKKFERHKDVEQTVFFHVETLTHDYKWVTAVTSDYKKDGKFVLFHPDFIDLFLTKEVGSKLVFLSEANAIAVAKLLCKLTDRPLRITRIQKVRIQKQVGKIFLPVGGV